MSSSLVLLNIVGGVCLLLFGLRLVNVGVTRGLGLSLRKVLERSTSNRFLASLSGIIVTIFLQSSTATTMLISGFVGRGLVSVVAGLAVVLGADIGTTLVAQILLFDVSWLPPLLIAVGYVFHSSKSNVARRKQMGRVFLGLGLALMALAWIKASAVPLKESEQLASLLATLYKDPIMALLVSIGLTWILHSSLAIVLLVASLYASHVIKIDLALLFILGANIGNVIAPLLLLRTEAPNAQKIPVGNLIMRIIGVAVTFPFIGVLADMLIDYFGAQERVIIHFHMLFNVALALVFLPFVGVVYRATDVFVQPNVRKKDTSAPLYLDKKDLSSPSLALTGASRETLRLAEMTEKMVETCFKAMNKNDETLLRRVKKMDDNIDSLYGDIKHYMARISEYSMSEKDSKMHFQTLTFATNLEHIGDIVDHNLLPVVEQKVVNHKQFSKEGFNEIKALFDMVLQSIKLAQSVYISGDRDLALQMIDDKKAIKKAEVKTNKAHMRRITDKVPETLDTSNMHMDLTRDLRRINSLITSVAYLLIEKEPEQKININNKKRKNNKQER